MRIGMHQLRLLVMMASPTCVLLTPDQSSHGLVKRGLLREHDGKGAACCITPAGLRALADEMEAGRVDDALALMKKDADATRARMAERAARRKGRAA